MRRLMSGICQGALGLGAIALLLIGMAAGARSAVAPGHTAPPVCSGAAPGLCRVSESCPEPQLLQLAQDSQTAAEKKAQEELRRKQEQQQQKSLKPQPRYRVMERQGESQAPAKAGTKKFGAQPVRSKEAPEGE